MMNSGTMARPMRDVVRSLRKLMAEKNNSFKGTFDIDCQLKLIPIQLLTLVNTFIDGPACTVVSQASLSIAQIIFQTLNLHLVIMKYHFVEVILTMRHH